MAREYIELTPRNTIGVITLTTSSFQTIAQNVIEEEENVQLGDLTRFKYPLSCKIVDDQLVINIDLKVKYGVNVSEACASLQAKIYDSINHMCDYTPDIIDIKVVGFIF
ncbi:MAG: Asp23/Gls24 family envelope stress response protein [Erysipelotrichaceae bacterium]